jgi:tRNA threonylcarbamoyladenosine biosynthesis protein TsaE
MMLSFSLADEQATLALGAQAAKSLHADAVVFLMGNLGTGKTTWTRGLLQALGHSGKVKSPTYTLVEPYQLADLRIYHFDLYRLNDPQELEDMGIRDYFDGSALCIIEWPEKAEGYLPAPDWVLALAPLAQGRQIVISSHSLKGESALRSMQGFSC